MKYMQIAHGTSALLHIDHGLHLEDAQLYHQIKIQVFAYHPLVKMLVEHNMDKLRSKWDHHFDVFHSLCLGLLCGHNNHKHKKLLQGVEG